MIDPAWVSGLSAILFIVYVHRRAVPLPISGALLSAFWFFDSFGEDATLLLLLCVQHVRSVGLWGNPD